MAFPGPGAQVYYNEAGEPIGWDYPSDEPPELDDDEYERRFGAADARAEEEYEEGQAMGEEDAQNGELKSDITHLSSAGQSGYNDGYDSFIDKEAERVRAELRATRFELAAGPPIQDLRRRPRNHLKDDEQ